MWDDDAGYDTSDPKHPGWADFMADGADALRKRPLCIHGYPDGCPDCDSPEWLPAVLGNGAPENDERPPQGASPESSEVTRPQL